MAIYTKLMPHQELILDFIKDKKYFGIFAEYGTGKSLTALAFIEKHNIRKTLVISTKTSVQSTWPQEIKKHTNFKLALLIGNKQQKLTTLYHGLRVSMSSAGYYNSSTSNNIVFLINFDGVKNIFNELLQADFDFIVIDESTKIKSSKTMRTKVLWALGKNIDKKCIMTGFPITENISEIYSQIKFLDNGETFGNSHFNFMEKYFNRIGYKYVAKKKGIDDILQSIKPFCIRVSGDVLKLPPKVYIPKVIEATEQQRKLLDDLNSTFKLEFGKVSIDTQYVFTLINKSLQICDGFIQTKVPKSDALGNSVFRKNDKGEEYRVMENILEPLLTNKDEELLELIEEIDARKNKIIVWFNHIFPLEKMERLITKMGYKPLTLYGETEDVNGVVNKFQFGKHNVLLATQKKASASITLTNCKYAIYYSTNWSYDERYNSEARIYRKGSEKHDSIVYTDLVTKDTVEDLVFKCLREKKNLVDVLKVQFGGLTTR
jgi:SNF2 family DNA or RNA helicase